LRQQITPADMRAAAGGRSDGGKKQVMCSGD
jgi:hypothetical protein